MSMMKMILSSEGATVEERQIARIKKEISSLTEALQYREKKLEKLRSLKKK
jgi:hypothetical protein